MPPTDPTRQLSYSFCCLQACVTGDLPAVAERLDAALAAGENLLAAAIDHGLTPLLYQRLQETSALERLGPERAQRLHDLHRRTLVFQAGAFDVTLQLLAQLAAAGITETLPLKGMALAALLWPSPLPRGLVDLDLLVAPEQIERAREVILAAGAVAPPIPWAPTPWEYHLPLLEYRGFGVELHWRLWPRSPLQPFRLPAVPDLLRRSMAGTLNEQTLRLPSAPDQFLIFAASLAQDGFAVGLRHWADLYWLRQRLDAGERARVWDLAEEYGLSAYMALVGRALGEILGEPPGGDETAALRGGAPTEEAHRLLMPVLWRRLLTPDPRRSSLWMLRALCRSTAAEEDWVQKLPEFLREQVGGSAARSAVTHCGGVLLAGGKLASRAGRLLFSRRERLALQDDLLLARVLGGL